MKKIKSLTLQEKVLCILFIGIIAINVIILPNSIDRHFENQEKMVEEFLNN